MHQDGLGRDVAADSGLVDRAADRVLLGIKRDIFLAIFALGFAYRALSSFRRWTNGKNLPLENRRRSVDP